MPCGWEGNRRSGHASQTSVVYRSAGVFDLTESIYRFISSPDLDSEANRMLWIRGRGPV